MFESKADIRKYYSELIMACLEKRQPDNIPEGIEAEELINYAKKGQIYYPIASSLIKLDIDEGLTGKIRNDLKVSTFRTLMQTVGGREITETFEREGIRHQLLKGAIIKKDYPSPEIREMSDIDLVVYDESLDKAAKAMEAMGYTNHGLIKHHMIFTKGNNLHVEVHWCLFDENVDHNQHVYFKNFRAKLVDGKKYTYEFSHEDFYVYMIAHMGKHFFETGCGIRNLMDIYIFWNKYGSSMDTRYLDKELAKCGLSDFEKNMRKLAFIWLDNTECPDFYENLFTYMLDSGIYGKSENGIWGQLAKETPKGKFARLHYYFPSYKFMVEKYKWLENKAFLLPFAWIVRGCSAARSNEARKHKQLFENVGDENATRMIEMYHKLNLNFRR
ncbi:nucleotidyltransferase family protein [Butyrivibrio proteoclasticus]|uniref:nucleotidyltransferase domain-containing protein n=1 Tax=Butyrivibrio proteoclasticus TaxID=43305 RepID=UPI000478F691|nr:nucleotidyltransferase family protein [Butyrivibrio proteoclasticus]